MSIEKFTSINKSEEQIEAISNNPIKYRNFLLELMVEKDASDIYLTVNEKPALRIYEQVYKMNLPELDSQKLADMADSLMTKSQKKDFEENFDCDLGHSHNNRRYRINISREQGEVMIVAKLLEEKVPTLDGLGMPKIFKDIIKTSSGIILFAGPTGSGKSTTLAAMIEEINRNQRKHIITMEDPIEYVYEPKKSIIEQKELHKDIQSYPKALRAALRQKPDVVLFGEMRDLDTVSNAITLAETGHLVMSTIHSKSSSQTINKIIDIFPSDQQSQIRVQLSETLEAIVSQRLLERSDKNGVIAAQEIMRNNSAIANLIRENQIAQINNTIQTNRSEGMQLLEDHMLELVLQGKIEYENALSMANNPKYLRTEKESRSIM